MGVMIVAANTDLTIKIKFILPVPDPELETV